MDQTAINAPIKEPLCAARRNTGGAIHLVQLSFKYCNIMWRPSAKLPAVQTGVNGPESCKSRAVSAENKFHAPPGAHQTRRQIHQLLHHCLYPAALGGVAHGGFPGNKPHLSDCAQDVVSQSPKDQNQGIGGELAGGEPFHVHVGFDFGMELLARAAVGIEPDHLFFGQIQHRPPSFDLDIGRQKALPATINGALHRPHDSFEPVGLAFVNLLHINGEQTDSFPFPGRGDLSFCENPNRPFALVFPPGVPLDDVADISSACQCNTGIKRVVGRVEAHKDFSGSKAAGLLHDSLNKGDKPFLAMLASRTQFQFETPPSLPRYPAMGAYPSSPV